MDYYDSMAYGEFCKKFYGADLKQSGGAPMSELDELAKRLPAIEGGRLLDLGCGAGRVTHWVARQKGYCAVGIDIDERALQSARETFREERGLEFLRMNQGRLDFPPASFDAIISIDSLQHCRGPEAVRKVLDKCYLLLKPNGVLAVFWSNKPSYPVVNGCVEGTLIGRWGQEKELHRNILDFTQSHRKYWEKRLQILLSMEKQFKAEGGAIFSELKKECISTLKSMSNAVIYRGLYLFTK